MAETAVAREDSVDVPQTLAAAYRGAVSSADAYRAVRTALRIESGILRLGNRFVAVDRYREVAFVALGNAAASLALGAWEALGERLTQGISAGPTVPPPTVPFRSWEVPAGLPGARAGLGVAESVDELSRELGSKDLLLVLLSPGALGCLSIPPRGLDGDGWRGFLGEAVAAGLSGREVALLAKGLGAGSTAGRLARRSGAGEVVTLLIDRGDGAGSLGGSPTIPTSTEEAAELPRLAARVAGPTPPPWLSSAGSSPPLEEGRPRATVYRPVVLAGPAEGLGGGSDALVDRRWVCRLADLSLTLAPEAAATRLASRTEELLGELGSVPGSGTKVDRRSAPHGLAVFAGLTLGLPEGVDESAAVDRFLEAARNSIRRRNTTVAVLPTGGRPASGGVRSGAYTRIGSGEGIVHDGLPMRAGLTDVGLLAVVLVRPPT